MDILDEPITWPTSLDGIPRLTPAEIIWGFYPLPGNPVVGNDGYREGSIGQPAENNRLDV
jgi:hypothetical protein